MLAIKRPLPYYAALLANGLFRQGERLWEQRPQAAAPHAALQARLRAEVATLVAALQAIPTGSNARDFWQSNEGLVCELIAHGNLDAFLRWPIILQTMFTDRSPWVWREFAFLRSHPLWESRWRPATRESAVGAPYRFMLHPQSSANLLHHAYHLCLLEERSRRPLADLELIVEFGGGYGSMARLCHNLGFRGRYILFDLPVFAALQRYYLGALDLPYQDLSVTANARLGTLCNLETLLKTSVPAQGSLFLATLSLCETPVSLRDQLLPWIGQFEQVLVTYSEQFGEIDNLAYFARMQAGLTRLRWTDLPLPHPEQHHMLFGIRSGSRQSALVE